MELGSETVERIKNLPVVIDVLSSLESDTFREYGSLSGYIPDQEKEDIHDRGFGARKAQSTMIFRARMMQLRTLNIGNVKFLYH